MTDTPETQPQAAAPGQMLKRARESRNLTVAAIATQMNLDIRIIEALEAGDQSRLPAPIFVRGYLRGYARQVGMPEAEVLGAYQAQAPQEPTPKAIGRSSAPLRPALRVPMIPWRGLLLTAIVIALGLLGFSYGPQLLRQFTGTPPVADVAAPETAPASGLELPTPEAADAGQSIPAPVVPMPPTATAPAADVADATGTLELALPAVAPSPERDAPAQPATEPALPADGDSAASDTAAAPAAAESTPQTAQATPTTETTAPAGTDTAGTGAPAEAQPVAAAAPGEVRMVFTFNAESWVEVRDAGGNKLLFDLMRKGDSREVSGKAPITAIIGNAGHVELRVNGERFDLAPHSRDDVARLRIESGSAGD